MNDPRKATFDAVKAIARPGIYEEPGTIDALNSLLDAFGAQRAQAAVSGDYLLTPRIMGEILHHESLVLEAYKDSEGVWTWGGGVTSASGHSVERYKDHPQTVKFCLEIYAWLLREKYLPGVKRAFKGQPLTEAQFAAALSFHWNTGAIERAGWVESWLAGDNTDARLRFMDWKKPASIIGRRTAERDLFFGSVWVGDGKTTIWPVKKPSYTPDWKNPQRVDISADLERLSA